MRRFLLFGVALAGITAFVFLLKKASGKQPDVPRDQVIQGRLGGDEDEEEDHDGYDGAAARDQFEFERIKDPALGYVPMERLMTAVDYTSRTKEAARMNRTAKTASVLSWQERGPIYDLVGASGNSRGGSSSTSGRTAAVLIDTLNDPSGNTAFCGGIAGGLWKCTNFLSTIPNWQHVDDRFDNLAISSICQNPANPSVLYFSTGEATSNIDAVYGGGVWKSTNGGTTWTKLPAGTGFLRSFKIACDAAGNVFLAHRSTGTPASFAAGLYRSSDGGTSWQNITPALLTSSNTICTDIEISTTGKLHASFGYRIAAGSTKVQHVYTNSPATVTASAGWVASTGLRTFSTVDSAYRLELATRGDVLYGVTVNTAGNLDSCYKSVDGGATWTKQNTTAFTTGILNGQGWYNLTLQINPSNFSEVLVGGLDLYKSADNGATFPTRMTYWISNLPYVHADHHFMQWWTAGAESRIVIGSDGGVFYSNDAGATFSDKNRNLAIKQFYDGGIHPAAGSPYLLAGAQDNGVHALTNPGLSYSTEVYGGDGCFVHINQQNPQIQFGSYVYNTYRRSTDGGATWSSISFSSSAGLFANPYDYDDGQNVLYASWGTQGGANNQILRWTDANTSTNASLLTLPGLSGGNPSTFKVSPFTKDRVFIGSSTGKLIRLDNAKTVTSANVNTNATSIAGAAFPTANLSCVNTGSSDNYLVATFSNYGVSHVFYSTDGGRNWTKIDGNLPDIPVRWALFDPQDNGRLFLATEAGVYSTDAVNGAGTVWNPDTNFPTVRTDVLKIRLSDNTVVAATHGRGLFTAAIPALPEIRFNSPFQTMAEATTGTTDCRGYRDYTVNVSSVAPPTGDATVTYTLQSGSTAIQGVDFDITTNGSFSSPSLQQVFQSGVGGTKTLTVRVYDDDAIEPVKNVTINFSVSGSTDAFAGPYNSFTLTIQDNDAPPSTPSALVSVGATSTGSVSTPFDATQQTKRTQMLYKASELTALGLTAGPITKVAFNIISKASTRPYQNFSIKMGLTSTAYLYNSAGPSFNNVSTATVKSIASYTTVSGWNTFVLDNSFTWDGVSNLVIETCYDNGTTDANNAADGTSIYSDGSASAISEFIFANNLACGSAYSSFSLYGSGTKPQIQLQIGNPVATTLNTAKTSYFGPDFDVPYYDNSLNIIARIASLSGFNYGCTQTTIDREGTSAQPFWNNNPANYLASKTVRVVPTINNTSGQYQITLYYSAAEKAGWEAATGQSWNNIKLIKVKSAIQNYTPATPAPDGANAVEIVTPVLGTYGPDYTVTGTFSSGFSGFGVGIPGNNPLPVTLLSFTGRLTNSTALLNWSTSTEQNAKSFDVEKSTDGITYYKIGEVKAAGISSTQKDYSLPDEKLSRMNYYRLRMNDLDGRSVLSKVVLLSYNAAGQNVWVVNNPFGQYIDLRLAKDAASVKLQLLNAAGSLVEEKTFVNTSGLVHWNLNKNLSNGTYVLRSVVDGVAFTAKLMKQ